MECEALSIEDKVATVHSALRVAGLVGGSRRLIDKRIFSVLVLFLVSSRLVSRVVSCRQTPNRGQRGEHETERQDCCRVLEKPGEI